MRGRLLLVLGVALTVLLRMLRRHPCVRALWAVSWFRDGRRRALRFLAPLLESESLEDRWAKVVSKILYASGALQYPVRYHKLQKKWRYANATNRVYAELLPVTTDSGGAWRANVTLWQTAPSGNSYEVMNRYAVAASIVEALDAAAWSCDHYVKQAGGYGELSDRWRAPGEMWRMGRGW